MYEGMTVCEWLPPCVCVTVCIDELDLGWRWMSLRGRYVCFRCMYTSVWVLVLLLCMCSS